jgi:hypothetical protein
MKALLPILALFVMAIPPAEAVKLWKWVDKDGKVTYSESPPPSQATKIENKHINPDQNVIQADIPPSSPASSTGSSAPDSDEGSKTPSDNRTQKNGAAGAGAAATTPPPRLR